MDKTDKRAAALWALSDVLMVLGEYNYCFTDAERQRVADKQRSAETAARACLEKLNLDETMLLYTRICKFRSGHTNSHILALVIEQLDRLPTK
jgi:hypothetical protein